MIIYYFLVFSIVAVVNIFYYLLYHYSQVYYVSNWTSVNNMNLNCEAAVRGLCEIRSIHSLPLFPCPLWARTVVLARVLSMCHIELVSIIWIKTTFYGEAAVLELCEIRSIHSLPLFPCPLWARTVVLASVLSMCHIELVSIIWL